MKKRGSAVSRDERQSPVIAQHACVRHIPDFDFDDITEIASPSVELCVAVKECDDLKRRAERRAQTCSSGYAFPLADRFYSIGEGVAYGGGLVCDGINWDGSGVKHATSEPLLSGINEHSVSKLNSLVLIDKKGSRFHYHMLTEVLPRLFVLRDWLAANPDCKIGLYSFNESDTISKKRLIEAHFPEVTERIVWLGRKNRVHVKSLYAFIRSECELPRRGRRPTRISKSLIAWVRCIQSEAEECTGQGMPARSAQRILYISRNDAASRRFADEDAFLHSLAGAVSKPIDYIVLKEIDPWSQRTAFRKSAHIVSPHGGGLANIIFCKKGVTLTELTSPIFLDRMTDFYDLSAVCGLKYTAALVGEQVCAGVEAHVALNRPQPLVDLTVSNESMKPLVSFVAGVAK